MSVASQISENATADFSVATEDETEEVVKEPSKPKDTVSSAASIIFLMCHKTIINSLRMCIPKPKGSAKIKIDSKAKSTPKSTPSTPKAPAADRKSIAARKVSTEKLTPIEPLTSTPVPEEPVISRSGRTIKPKR